MRYLSLILVLALGACSTSTFKSRLKPIGVGLRVGAGATLGSLSATQIVPKSRTTSVAQQDDFSGDGFRGRVEVFKTLARKRALEVGLYASRGAMDYEEEDVQTQSLGLSLRGFLRPEGLRPYVEVRGGYREQEQGSVVPGSPDTRLSGDGWTAGLGIGLEVPLGGNFGMFLQLDADYAEVDIGGAFTGNTAELGVLLGGTVRF